VVPYFELHEIPIGGGRSIAAFGTLVAVGIFAGAWFVERRARLTGLPEREIPGAILSAVVPGVLLAHLVALMPELGTGVRTSPRVLVEFWNGMSSFGGLLGAFLGLSVFYWRSGRAWLPTADVLVQGFVGDFLRQTDLPAPTLGILVSPSDSTGVLFWRASASRSRREVGLERRGRAIRVGRN
jgi:prolipoprotein diacylglyceryltransferase